MANRHPRVNILQPGPGVGGHCIAVDPWFIISETPEEARLIRTAREVNDSKPHWVIDQVNKAVTEHLEQNPDKTAKEVTIACLGLAFKADIEDLRESPALAIATAIAEQHPGQVLAVEPNIQELPDDLVSRLLLASPNSAVAADIVVLLVDHKGFKKLPADVLEAKRVVDTRGLWS